MLKSKINSKINFCLVLVIVFVSLVLLKHYFKVEYFSIPKYYQVENRILYNILPNNENQFVGSIIPKEFSDFGTLILTNSVKSNQWRGPIDNSIPEPNSIIVDLTFDKDRHLMCVAETKKNDIIVYTIFKKKSTDIRSKWTKIPSNENIRSIVYDKDGILIGCHGDSGQLYKKKSADINSDWVGPINYDIPMKKVMFDKDGVMLGIGFIDYNIYKKVGAGWDTHLWDRDNRNKIRVFDMYHDLDGCLVATSYRGVVKQINNSYISPFVPYKQAINRKQMLSLNDVIYFRTGIDFNIKEPKIKLSKPLQELLTYKKMAMQICNKRNRHLTKSNRNLGKINQQKVKIDELDKMIKEIQKKF